VLPSNFKFKNYSHNPSDSSLLVVGDANVKHNNSVITSTLYNILRPIAKIQINLKGEKGGVAYQMLHIVNTIEMKLLMPPSIR
jgi:hypothetical protein